MYYDHNDLFALKDRLDKIEISIQRIFNFLEQSKLVESRHYNNKDDGLIWDSRQVMNHFGISQRTLAQWRKDNKIKFIKIGGIIRYPALN